MSNDINNLGSVNTLITPSTQTPGSKADKTDAQASTAVPTQSADTLNITSSASLLQKLESKARELPVVDSERVDQVRQALNNGTQAANPDRITQKLLQFESYMPG